MKRFTYLKAFCSPFKRPRLKWYFGKVAIGTPHFLPRRWVKNPAKPGYQTAVDKRIGFDFVGLGWKTKYDSFRFESAPLISFVFFGLQIAVIIKAPHQDHYWECWLAYELDTDHSLPKLERLQLARERRPCVWTTSKDGIETKTNYWNEVLKKRWLLEVKPQNRGLTSYPKHLNNGR